jgi:hypothetical protein
MVDLHNVLLDLKLTPDALEVPIPRYFVEDRAQARAHCARTDRISCNL